MKPLRNSTSKKTQSEGATPKAPNTLNRLAPAYERLRNAFETSGGYSLLWRIDASATIFTKWVDDSGATQYQKFTQTEMIAVCPSLFDMLAAQPSLYTDRWNSLGGPYKLWRHCIDPGLYVQSSANTELYLRKLVKIETIDLQAQTLTAHIEGYELKVERKNVNNRLFKKLGHFFSGTTADNNASDWRICNNFQLETDAYKVLDLVELEKKWPGLTTRAVLGVDLGLTEEELAQFAMNENYPVKKTEFKAVLPELGLAYV